MIGAHWQGQHKGKDLANNTVEKEFFQDGQAVHFAVTFQKARVKYYIDKRLVMNATGFAPVMPRIITLRFFESEFRAIKDIRLATRVPDIVRLR